MNRSTYLKELNPILCFFSVLDIKKNLHKGHYKTALGVIMEF